MEEYCVWGINSDYDALDIADGDASGIGRDVLDDAIGGLDRGR